LRLLTAAPARSQAEALAALDAGLAERPAVPGGMGMADLFASFAVPKSKSKAAHRQRGFEPLTPALVAAITAAWRTDPAEIPRLRLALRAGVADASTAVLADAAAAATSTPRRCALLRLLAEFPRPETIPLAADLFRGDLPLELRLAALDVLASHDDARVARVLLDGYAQAPLPLRSRIINILLSHPASALAFLERIDRHEIAAADVPVDDLRRVALHSDGRLDALVRKLWGQIEAGTPEEKLAEMRRLNNDLRAGSGDRAQGRELYRKHCASCHKLLGEGTEIGPDLTGTSRHDTPALLASVVDPGAVVRTPYLQYAVVTTSGRIQSGILAAQDGASITLVDAQNQRTTIARDSIEELRALPGSLMPENLLKPLSPQEVRDLFAYLQGPQP
jgi:putative heme-binding domain-containing protein